MLERSQTPLDIAVLYNQTSAAEWLIDASVFFGPDNLVASARCEKPVILQSLLDRGSFDNKTLRIALFRAVQTGRESSAKNLLGAGASVTFAILKTAIELDHLTIIKCLIAAGADVSSRGDNGETLLYAVRSPSVATMILEQDLGLADIRSSSGESPLNFLYAKLFRDQDVDLASIAQVLL
ncbi:hypothetical protein AJ80_00914 [Polytolypa hystricis UAMH7299]|uniref:Uncharacterized protein n=1 Tax=Polytolypa hystricis (strain UAMH7299) TaxID=1447883 RepID=A0A2B7Z0I3_POLH7|nr:hypothetical protein AJ80_00914 [Polytolypa hystricis UAMH7299]